MANNEWDLRIPEEDRFRARCTNITRIKRVLDILKDSLTDQQLEMFRNSIFGHFMDIDTDFKGMLVHNLLLRQVVQSPEDDNQLWFKIGDSNLVRFSIREWCLVTGLNCGEDTEIPAETHDFRDRYFGRVASLGKLGDIDEIIKSFDFENTPDTDALKIALYYFAERCLFARADVRRLNEHIMLALEDLDTFNSLPWGTWSFNSLCESIRSVLNGKAEKFKKEKQLDPKHDQEKYNINGFSLGFQV